MDVLFNRKGLLLDFMKSGTVTLYFILIIIFNVINFELLLMSKKIELIIILIKVDTQNYNINNAITA